MLAEEEDNSNGLINRNIGKSQGAVWTQMQLLYERGYLTKSKAKRNAYAINPLKTIPAFNNRIQKLEESMLPIKEEIKKIRKFIKSIEAKQ